MNYIFDMDGTLIDSYFGITNATLNALNEFNINKEFTDVKNDVLSSSVYEYLKNISYSYNISFQDIYNKYKENREFNQNEYSFMPNVIDTLVKLYNNKNRLFIFTHKGKYTINILKDNNIDYLFLDVIHSDMETFDRKPSNKSILYIMNKYQLDPKETYYVGDRDIDILVAKNSNIKSIYYKSSDIKLTNKPDYIINDFKQILNIEEI